MKLLIFIITLSCGFFSIKNCAAQTPSHGEIKFGQSVDIDQYISTDPKAVFQLLLFHRYPTIGTGKEEMRQIQQHQKAFYNNLDSITREDQRFLGLMVVFYDSPNDSQRKKGQKDPSLIACDASRIELKKEYEFYARIPNGMLGYVDKALKPLAFQTLNICDDVYSIVAKDGTCIYERAHYFKIVEAIYKSEEISNAWALNTTIRRVDLLELQIESHDVEISGLNKRIKDSEEVNRHLQRELNSYESKSSEEIVFGYGFRTGSKTFAPNSKDANVKDGLTTTFENRISISLRSRIDTLKWKNLVYGFHAGLANFRYRQRIEMPSFGYSIVEQEYIPEGFRSLVLRGHNADERFELSYTSFSLGSFIELPFTEKIRMNLIAAPTLNFISHANSYIDDGSYSIYGLTQGYGIEITGVDSLGFYKDINFTSVSKGIAYRSLNLGIDLQMSLHYQVLTNVGIELMILRAGRNLAVASNDFEVRRFLSGTDRDTFVKLNQNGIDGAWFGQIGITLAL